jgi:hypothetical protein
MNLDFFERTILAAALSAVTPVAAALSAPGTKCIDRRSFQVQRLSDGQTYALKEMDVRSMSQAEREVSLECSFLGG